MCTSVHSFATGETLPTLNVTVHLFSETLCVYQQVLHISSLNTRPSAIIIQTRSPEQGSNSQRPLPIDLSPHRSLQSRPIEFPLMPEDVPHLPPVHYCPASTIEIEPQSESATLSNNIPSTPERSIHNFADGSKTVVQGTVNLTAKGGESAPKAITKLKHGQQTRTNNQTTFYNQLQHNINKNVTFFSSSVDI